MFKFFCVFSLLVISELALAKSYFCTGVYGAGIKDSGQVISSPENYDMSSIKLILSNSSGSWKLKNHGGSPVSIEDCETEYLCRGAGKMFGGSFKRNNDGVFTYHFFSSDPSDTNSITDYIVKGLCSEI
jgi:hypothetical protein